MTKKIACLACGAVLFLSAIMTSCLSAQGISKKYPPGAEGKYWFELNNDLIFSEEFHLPGYEDSEYGKLEYPAIAIDKEQNLYVAYNFTANGKEAVYVNRFATNSVQFEAVTDTSANRRYLKMASPPAWQTALQVSAASGVEYRPRIAVSSENVVWIVWSARRNKTWNIFARTMSKGQLGEEIQVTNSHDSDFRPVIFADASGKVWLAWERGVRDKNIHIIAKYFQDGVWSDEIIIENRPGYAYRPTMTESNDGSIWFAWDYTRGHNTDVYINRIKNDKQDEPIRVTNHPAIDCKAALTWRDDKLWIAWTTNRRAENGWGIIRYPMTLAFNGKKWFEPIDSMKNIALTSRSETQSYEYPTLTFDSFGRLYLFNRHDHVFSAAYYEGGEWSQNWLLDESGWGLRGFYVQTAWASKNELWLARRDRATIFLQKMTRQNPRKTKPQLREYQPKRYPQSLNGVEEKPYRGPAEHGNYKTFFGDLHVHTAYSDGSGSFDELYNLYKNIYRLDFLAITDHDALRLGRNHFSPGEWAYLKALNEIYNQPGEFATFNAYEWTHSTWSGRQDSTVLVGHKNVYFRGGEESPFFNHHGKEAHDAVSLFEILRKHNGLAFPHHPPWSGITWEDHDPEIQSNYEIISIHGANEHMGNLPIPHRGGLPGTFAQDGLAKGKIIGFVGASDSHGLYHHSNEGWRDDPYKGGWTGVLLDTTLTRESVWQALQARRNYATAGEKHYLEFFINGFPMGSEITTKQPPIISFKVRSSNILYAYVIRDNQELFISGKIGGAHTAYKGMRDETITPGKHFYYLRVVYKDDTISWSSPIWVDYQ